MAIERMKMVNIIGKYEMLDDTIEAYLDSGCFQPESTAQLIKDSKGFTHINDENPYAARFARLAEILKNAGVDPKPIENPGPKPDDELIKKKLDILEERLGALQNQRQNLMNELTKNREAIEQFAHFSSFDINLNEVFSSKFIKVRFGRIPNESYQKLQFYDHNPYVLFFPCSTEGEYLWGMYVVPAESEDEVDNIFSSLFFERLRIPDAAGTPIEAVELLTKLTADYSAQIKELDEIIREFNELEMDDYIHLYSQLKRAYDAFEIRRYGTRYGDSFMLVGWIPESMAETFTECMDKVDAIEFSFEDPNKSQGLNPPTKLNNKKFFKPFEYYVEMFGFPSYGEIDPTPFLAVTYTLLFGIMFADVGQGLILSLIGYLMYKFKGMALGRIIIPCGIAGSLFGFVFGSVFGFEHLLDPLYKAIGFSEKPIDAMESINEILIMAVAIGIVMMVIAISLNIFVSFKRRRFKEALVGENGICGLILYLSLIVILLSLFVPEIAPFDAWIFLLGFILPVIILIFKEPIGAKLERKKFKPDGGIGEYLMQSFFEAFEALISYATNTVSFLRVGAFVLVHAGMMMVFFILADMVGGGLGGAIVIIFGNIMVIALEGLLVGIQSLRLEFYEMFNRFYEGEGRAYDPVTLNSSIDEPIEK